MNVLNVFICLLLCIANTNTQYCEKPDEYGKSDHSCSIQSRSSNKRYIFYDVNPPEGFNLRRDVYMRAAIFVKNLREKDKRYDWRLVLPPWGNLYHWKSNDVGVQIRLPWGKFFDLDSLKKFVPVMEMYQFFKDVPSAMGGISIDRTYILQNDEEMFKTGLFEDKNELVECSTSIPYKLSNNDKYTGRFWGYSNITTKEVKCLIFHGTMLGLEENLLPETYSTVMFDHVEIALHDSYGTKEYWTARRSMRYNSELYDIANYYREKYLDSNDNSDNTIRPLDWRKEKGRRDAIGGPYLCVHLRRRDFVTARRNSIPTIEQTAQQLSKKLDELNLKVVFVSTDAQDDEYEELRSYLGKYKVMKYFPTENVKKVHKDGGVAIIDQIICSYARFFIGTHESTFTFRIQEDREIIGFPANTTFNRLCGKGKCNPGGQWEIVWR